MVRMNMLFSYYQSLLTKKQQQMLALYYEEDYSLGEIAEHYQISRQAVYDTIKRSEKALEQYEANL
ncbi:MAG TPA: helix-turn-helix domain-containing protein, partial [Globicatella sulfidifaciens]|nr:helix-turn-helix domain-containing protein [Globicatella sulfidifaciens]